MTAVEMKVVPLDNTLTRPRRGRPLGSTGPQIERVKHRLASLVVLGKRNGEIAKALRVSSRTIRSWLKHPDVQQAIEEATEEFNRRTERLMLGLFRRAITCLARIMKHGDNRTRLRAVEMVLIAQGRLPPKGAHVTLCNHSHLAMADPGRQPFDHADVKAAMRLLRREREAEEERERREAAGTWRGNATPLGRTTASANGPLSRQTD